MDNTGKWIRKVQKSIGYYMSESMNQAVSSHQVQVRADVQYSQHRMIHTPIRISLTESWRFHRLRAYLPERNRDPFVCLGGSGTSSLTPDPSISAVTLLNAKDGSSIRYSCSLFLRTSPFVSVHSLTHVQRVQVASYISLKPLSAGGSYVGSCIIRTRTEGWMTSDVQTGASFATSSGESLNTPEAALQRRECHGFTSGGESVTIFDLVTKPLPFGLPLPFLTAGKNSGGIPSGHSPTVIHHSLHHPSWLPDQTTHKYNKFIYDVYKCYLCRSGRVALSAH